MGFKMDAKKSLKTSQIKQGKIFNTNITDRRIVRIYIFFIRIIGSFVSPPRLPPAMRVLRQSGQGFQKASDFVKARYQSCKSVAK
jgi:hypothetical protein